MINALSDLGRKDEALKAYDTALEILEKTDSPHTEIAREYLAKLRAVK